MNGCLTSFRQYIASQHPTFYKFLKRSYKNVFNITFRIITCRDSNNYSRIWESDCIVFLFTNIQSKTRYLPMQSLSQLCSMNKHTTELAYLSIRQI